jgi:hypothetical protein
MLEASMAQTRTTMEGLMRRSRFSFLCAIFFAIGVLCLLMEHAAAQEVDLAKLDVTEVAKGYSADGLKLKPVVNDKGEAIGTIHDFILGKDGNIYAVLAVGDFTGLSGNLVAVPFRSLKLDDPHGYIELPGASRAALHKLPVFLYNK